MMRSSVDTLLDDTEVIRYPFAYVVKQPALPQSIYAELCRLRPSDEEIGEGLGPNQRRDIHTRSLKAHGVLKGFIDYHTGYRFWYDVLRVFGDDIESLYPGLKNSIKSIGVRGMGNYDLSTECQIGINSPCEARSRVIGPHLDNSIELYAGLLYMPADDDPGGGDLEIRRYIKEPRFHGKQRLDESYTEIVATVKYVPNTFAMFINSPQSIHSVSERGPCTQYRRLVNIIGEVRAPLFGVSYA